MANTLEIKIWSTSDPNPTNVGGGSITSTNNGDGTWTLTSTDRLNTIGTLSNKEDITKIEVTIFESWTVNSTFAGLVNMTDFIWNSELTPRDWEYAFKDCSSLTKLSGFDLLQAFNVKGTFEGCTNLIEISTLSFGNLRDESRVDTFKGCINLINPGPTGTSVRDGDNAGIGVYDVDNTFDVRVDATNIPDSAFTGGTVEKTTIDSHTYITSKENITGFSLQDVSYYYDVIIYNGGTLKTLANAFKGSYLRNFEWYGECNLTDISFAWNECEHLPSFPMMDTSKVTNFESAWGRCTELTSFPPLDLSSATTLKKTWYRCENLTSCPVINTSNVTDFDSTWDRCKQLTAIPQIDTSNGTNFRLTWNGCSSIETFPALDFSNGTNFSGTWSGMYGLTEFPQIDVSKGTNFDSAFHGLVKLTTFPSLDFSNSTNMRSAFDGCSNLSTFPEMDFSKVENLWRTWKDCVSLKYFPKLDFSSVTNGDSAFSNCSVLLYPPPTGTPVRNGSDATQGTWELTGPKPATFEIIITSSDDPMPSTVEGGSITSTNNGDGTWTLISDDPITHFSDLNAEHAITKVEVIVGDTLTSLESSFSRCTNLTDFVWNGYCVVNDFSFAWSGCSKLTNITGLTTSHGTNFYGTWKNCSSLLELPEMDFSSATDMSYTWFNCTNLQRIPALNLVNLSDGNGVNTFDGIAILAEPNDTGNPVRMGSDSKAGLWPVTDDLIVKIWSHSRPYIHLRSVSSNGPKYVGNGLWYFRVAGAEELSINDDSHGITKIEILNGSELKSLESGFQDNINLQEFKWHGICNVSDFNSAWYGCSSLTSFPQMDVSRGTDFNDAWAYCSSLTSFPQLDFSNALSFDRAWSHCSSLTSFPELNSPKASSFQYTWGYCGELVKIDGLDFSSISSGTNNAFKECDKLISPPPTGTTVRSGNSAKRGTWVYLRDDVLTFNNVSYETGVKIMGKPTTLVGKLGFTVMDGNGTKWIHNGSDWVPWGIGTLEPTDEGNGTGWRITGRDPNNYGNIGQNAIDLTTSGTPSEEIGATGEESITVGHEAVASGETSFAGGTSCEAVSVGTVSLGYKNKASGSYSVSIVGGLCSSNGSNSFSGGVRSIADGHVSIAFGHEAHSTGDASFAVGQFCKSVAPATVALGANLTTNSKFGCSLGVGNKGNTDSILEVGVGQLGPSGDLITPKNALEVKKIGTVYAPECTITDIENADGKILVTKEYLEQLSPKVMDITWDELVTRQSNGKVEVWDRYNITDQNNLKIEIKTQSPSGYSFFEVTDDNGITKLKQIK